MINKYTLAALMFIIAYPYANYSYDLASLPSNIFTWIKQQTNYLYHTYNTTTEPKQLAPSEQKYPYSIYRDPKFDPKQQEEPMVTAKQPLEELEKPTPAGDAFISRFVNNWRDAGDIRREFENPQNFPLLATGFIKPLTNVDVNEPEHPDVYDIRNLLLPPQPLLKASKAPPVPTMCRTYDAKDKYEIHFNKMTYVMRQNTGYRDFIGFITFYLQPEQKTDGYIEIMLISKQFRGQKNKNYAARLIHFALQKMKSMGVSRVTLVTGLDNTRACNFYEKIGFTKSPQQPHEGYVAYEINMPTIQRARL